MLKTIFFKKTTSFLGRNGEFKCKGISIASIGTPKPEYILIEPITSKDTIGRCSIRIPAKEIDTFCNLLKEAKNK